MKFTSCYECLLDGIKRHSKIGHYLDRTRDWMNFSLKIKDLSWCPGPESNRHALRRGILSPLRLPISPPGPWGIAREALWNEDVHYTVYKNFAREALLRYPQAL